jgi:hypothetical protein
MLSNIHNLIQEIRLSKKSIDDDIQSIGDELYLKGELINSKHIPTGVYGFRAHLIKNVSPSKIYKQNQIYLALRDDDLNNSVLDIDNPKKLFNKINKDNIWEIWASTPTISLSPKTSSTRKI